MKPFSVSDECLHDSDMKEKNKFGNFKEKCNRLLKREPSLDSATPPDAVNTSCLDFFKKNNRRFHDNNMMESLLLYKYVTSIDDLDRFRENEYEEARKEIRGLRTIFKTQLEMQKTVEMYQEILREPNPDEEMAKLMDEFKYWTKYLQDLENDTIRKVEAVAAQHDALEKKFRDSWDKLAEFRLGRTFEKPRIWFWQ